MARRNTGQARLQEIRRVKMLVLIYANKFGVPIVQPHRSTPKEGPGQQPFRGLKAGASHPNIFGQLGRLRLKDPLKGPSLGPRGPRGYRRAPRNIFVIRVRAFTPKRLAQINTYIFTLHTFVKDSPLAEARL